MSIADQINYDWLRKKLMTDGAVQTGPDEGKKLFLIDSHNAGIGKRGEGLLVAWEGEGAFYWDKSRPINRFRLIERGFSIIVAPTLSDILNRLVGFDPDGSGLDASSSRRLGGPEQGQ